MTGTDEERSIGVKPMYVYIMTNHSGTLYIGVTNDVHRRAAEHRQGVVPGFTSRYAIQYLVHVERYDGPRQAIAREKQLKGWRRDKKIALIERSNPTWSDLSDDSIGVLA
jgi:putative endonuclease